MKPSKCQAHSGIAALLVVFLGWSPAPAHAGKPGEAGAPFLRIGMGARASAMGEAFTGVAGDASAVFWNPAAMSPLQGTHVLLAHNEYIQTVRLEQGAITHETELGTIGLSFTGLYMDDLERRENVPTAVPLGTFSVYDLAFAAAYSRYITPNLTVGVSVKPVYQRIDDLSASGLAVDAGLYHITRMRGVTFSAVVGNIGRPMKFDQQEFALPRYVKVGGAYRRDIPRLQSHLLAAVDAMFPNDDGVRTHWGVELDYQHRLFLRGGYKSGYDSAGATFGVGVTHRQFSLDYAFLNMSNNLGNSHRFSVGISL